MVQPNICVGCEVGSCALITLKSSELEHMGTKAYHAEFRQGEIIRKQETPLDSIIYVRSGFVKEYISYPNAPDQVIQIIKPRTYIGLQGIGNNPLSIFSYQSITRTEICFIERSVFRELIRGNGSFAEQLLISLGQESVNNHKRFLSLNQTQTFGKVAGLLLYFSEEIYNHNTFNLYLKRAELAQMVASTRESVTRVLRWMHNEGLISMDKNMISILDKPRLEELAKKG